MFHCPMGVWVIEQRAIILSATVRSPTVHLEGDWSAFLAVRFFISCNSPGACFRYSDVAEMILASVQPANFVKVTSATKVRTKRFRT